MNKNVPIVSIILPTYNRAQTIVRSVQSILDQTYSNFELIVIDDSSDNTEKIISNFKDGRIRYIKNNVRKGAGAARNSGIKAARGKYVAFQDSDDEWLPEKLEKQIKVMETALPETGVVYSDMIRISESGETKYWRSPTVSDGQLINPQTLDYQTFNLGVQSTIIKKQCFEYELFDEELPHFEDMELFIRLARHYRFEHINEPLVKYYAPGGITASADGAVRAQNLLFKKYSDEINNNRRFLSKWYFRLGYQLCLDGQFNRGRAYLFKAVKKYPINIKYIAATFASLMGQKIYNRCAEIYKRTRMMSSSINVNHTMLSRVNNVSVRLERIIQTAGFLIQISQRQDENAE